MPLIEKVNKKIRENVKNVNDFKIILKKFITEISKIKIWTTSAIDEILKFLKSEIFGGRN